MASKVLGRSFVRQMLSDEELKARAGRRAPEGAAAMAPGLYIAARTPVRIFITDASPPTESRATCVLRQNLHLPENGRHWLGK